MATVAFTSNLERHVECPTRVVHGASVRAVLDAVFAANPRLRGYVLDDQGALRRHMMVFVDGQQIEDRERLSHPVGLPDRFAFDLVYRHALALGRGPGGATALAFGSTTGNVFASTDRGQTWSAVSHHLPPVHAVTFAD